MNAFQRNYSHVLCNFPICYLRMVNLYTFLPEHEKLWSLHCWIFLLGGPKTWSDKSVIDGTSSIHEKKSKIPPERPWEIDTNSNTLSAEEYTSQKSQLLWVTGKIWGFQSVTEHRLQLYFHLQLSRHEMANSRSRDSWCVCKRNKEELLFQSSSLQKVLFLGELHRLSRGRGMFLAGGRAGIAIPSWAPCVTLWPPFTAICWGSWATIRWWTSLKYRCKNHYTKT